MKKLIGIDVGGTTTKIGIFENNGDIIDQFSIVTRKEDHGSHIIPDICEAINLKLGLLDIDVENILSIGVGLPGPVDSKGICRTAVNLGWSTVDIAGEFKKYFDLPIKAANDANVAAIGEMWKGLPEPTNDVVFITLGTGVGGGIIIDGKLVDGTTGCGGEIGHITIDHKHNFMCNCGRTGCLETVCSATGIVNLANELLEYRLDTKLLAYPEISARLIFDLAKENDPVCVEVVDEFARVLGLACANLAVISNPEYFIIGGGVSAAGDFLLNKVHVAFMNQCFANVRNTNFALATLGNDAGIIGAAYIGYLNATK